MSLLYPDWIHTEWIENMGALEGLSKNRTPRNKKNCQDPWRSVRFESPGWVLMEDISRVMGKYFFTNPAGVETNIEYLMGYWRGE